jgi:hypothetical protein
VKTYKKKIDAMDLLVTHRPSKEKTHDEHREATPDRETSESGRERLNELKKRLVLTHDREKIEEILESIQADFGNDVAERIIKELRLTEDEDERT